MIRSSALRSIDYAQPAMAPKRLRRGSWRMSSHSDGKLAVMHVGLGDYVYTELSYLVPAMRAKVEKLMKILTQDGFRYHVSQTYRAQNVQDSLFDKSKGLVNAGKTPITMTKTSRHNVGQAIDLDIIPATRAGGFTTAAGVKYGDTEFNSFDYLLDTWESLGGQDMRKYWGKTGRTLGNVIPNRYDQHHLEDDGGLTFEEAKKQYASMQVNPTPNLNIGQAVMSTTLGYGIGTVLKLIAGIG